MRGSFQRRIRSMFPQIADANLFRSAALIKTRIRDALSKGTTNDIPPSHFLYSSAVLLPVYFLCRLLGDGVSWWTCGTSGRELEIVYIPLRS